MLKLSIEHPAEVIAMMRALLAYLEAQPELPAERSAEVQFQHDESGMLTSVTVTLDE